MTLAAGTSRRLRGTIIKLVCVNHSEQGHRFDLSALWHALVRDLSFTVNKRDVKTTLQDLGGRGYIKYKDHYDEKADEFLMSQIETTPKGRDLLEGTITDPAVEL